MAHNMNELKRLIVEKNLLLKSMSRDDSSANEKIEEVKYELDNLLYRYFKSIKFKKSSLSI